MAGAGRKSSLAGWSWVLVAGVALFELATHAWIRAATPSDESWATAASFVRDQHRPGDRIVAAPGWADPLVRYHLGDLSSLRTASADDGAGTGRVWELSIRDAQADSEPPAVDRRFEDVRVRMWPAERDGLVFDFVEEVESAEVELVTPTGVRPCPLRHLPVVGGGLGRGPFPPTTRFVCDPARPWLWVGSTVMADLDLRPRRCVWQHPAGTEPVRTTFREVPLGDTFVLEGGLDYNNARTRGEVPVRVAVFIDDRLSEEMRVRDADGWDRLEIDTARLDGTMHDVRIETTAPISHGRTLCWAASARHRQGRP